ncbi:MAG: SpoIIIAH-like family protein [Clostridia bacterium]|nr:SpoIIIAH-like family protein [Clostridia bacterium]
MKKLFAKKESNATESAPAKKERKLSASNRKKIFVICTMVVLLVAAAYLNVLLADQNTDSTGSLQNNNLTSVSVFSAMKSDRDTVRAQTYSYLDSIINSTTASEEAKKAAEDKKLTLINYAGSEVVLENLIKARGFSDACVTMNGNNVNVLVQDADLDATEVAQILYIVTEETGAAATDVIIVPKS